MISPIEYIEPVYRPPSEAQSLLIPVTIGCSYNRCTFCAMYRGKRYSVRSLEAVKSDIEKAANFFQRRERAPRKVFLCDGDALAAPQELLLNILAAVQTHLPNTSRVGIYASARNVLCKTQAELEELAAGKLNIAYLGIESGSDNVLNLVNKGVSAVDTKEACLRLRAAGWKVSQIYMLGLGGKELSAEHCSASASLAGETSPNFLSFLTTAPVPGTPYASAVEAGQIQCLTIKQLLMEMRAIITAIDPAEGRIIFRANHVSNLFPLEGILPKDRAALLGTLDGWLAGCPENTILKIPSLSESTLYPLSS